MAKRTPRSQADDSTAAPAAPSKTTRGRTRASAAPEPSDTIAARPEPSEDDIRLRAYHRYLERGGGHGMDFDDWLEAERDLKARH